MFDLYFAFTTYGFLNRIPLPVQLAIIFIMGWITAIVVNKISRWVAAWFDKLTRFVPEGETLQTHLNTVRQAAYVELFGWSALYGLLVSLIYYWFICRGGIASISQLIVNPEPGFKFPIAELGLRNFIYLFIAFGFLLTASLTDIRRKIIPDFITITGTITALLLSISPLQLTVPIVQYSDNSAINGSAEETMKYISSLNLCSPYDAGTWIGQPAGLLLALSCWLIFVIVYLYRRCYFRHGLFRGFQLYFLRSIRLKSTYITLGIGLVGVLLLTAVWNNINAGQDLRVINGLINTPVVSVLSSLTGMAAGGILIWLVRIIGTVCLKREAMGFGDVTLMMMIGAFTGWQAILPIFFLSPVVGVIVGVLMLVFQKDRYIPFGPFLCLATAVWFLFFPEIWAYCFPLYQQGAVAVLIIMLLCLILMGAMLYGIRKIKEILQIQ